MNRIRVGTAGWAIPRAVADAFPAEGSALERYAARLPAAEINSSFYRPHRPATYARWAAAVPDGFRFSVKLPRSITHDLRLAGVEAELERFLRDIAGLGAKLGPLLVQLPPSLIFEAGIAAAFLLSLRDRHEGGIALEPRHPTWFGVEPDELLREHRVARVAADPARVPEAAEPGGWPGLVYLRLHGSPRTYYSSYGEQSLDALAARLREAAVETWCIFDNTASGAAAANALGLLASLEGG
ncbi:DUF72 domain-containing protein [Enterovirga aerilata]|uniref:DUF72 domain-containing protein n=1 Tax=Enterovirga aerilata TaxID=2730920 RepID=UPI001AED562E|nr:DUF72 domain-containing protein [Enterovirga sp. DB1703]